MQFNNYNEIRSKYELNICMYQSDVLGHSKVTSNIVALITIDFALYGMLVMRKVSCIFKSAFIRGFT